MKILSIRIKNLASLADEHFIDFEAQPLANAGLIAITGKTGAGKSTILDAMCLALFNRIPRLKDAEGKIKDADDSEISSNSTLTVLRRGSSHGFAELQFLAQDQKVYAARWELKRAKDKVDGKLQKIQRSLKCLSDDTILASSTNAVEQQLRSITKLTFEQFTRAVLLAQSEVTAFLKAKDNERGELLEYLTNSNIFGKIGELAYRKTKEISLKKAKLNDVIGQIDLLSEEQLVEIQTAYTQLEQQQQQLNLEQKELEKQQLWYQQQQKIEHDLHQQQEVLNQTQQQQLLLAPQQQLLAQLEVFNSIRPTVFQQQQAQNNAQKIQPELAQLQQNFELCKQSYQQIQQKYQQEARLFEQTQQFEQQHSETLNTIRQCVSNRILIGQQYKSQQLEHKNLIAEKEPLLEKLVELKKDHHEHNTALNKLHHDLAQSQHLSTLDEGLSTHLQQVRQISNQLQKLEQQFGDLDQLKIQFNTKKQQLEQLQQQSSSLDLTQQLPKLRQDIDQTQYQINQALLLQDKLAQYNIVEHEIAQVQQQHAKHLQDETQYTLDVQQLETQYNTVKSERETVEKFIQQQRLLHADNVEKLRENLQAGEACLVCGSTEHPYRQDHSLVSKTLFDLQQQQSLEIQQQEHTCFNAWQAKLIQIKETQATLQQLQQRQTQLQSQHADLISALNTLQKSAAIELNLTQPITQIEQAFANAQQQQQLSVRQLTDQFNQLDNQLKTQQQLTADLQQQQHAIEQFDLLFKQLQSILVVFNHQQPTLKDLTQLEHQLQQRLALQRDAQALEKNIQYSEQTIKDAENHIKHLNEKLTAAIKKQEEFVTAGQKNTDDAIQLIAKISNQQVEKPSDWLKAYESNRDICTQNHLATKKEFDAQLEVYEQQRVAVNQLQTQHQQFLAQMNDADHALQQWLTTHPLFSMQLVQQLHQIDFAQEQQLRQQLQQADQQFHNAQSILNTLTKQLTEHLIKQPNISFSDLQLRLNVLPASIKDIATEMQNLDFKLKMQHINQNKLAEFATEIQQIQQEEMRWHKISSVMGDATGKKFRDYAQQYHLDILLEHANLQLQQLSQRYTLQRLENTLSLAIVDHDMDGEVRSVASLSGGESFLAALALSLAIANMASGELKIESLFIDEGFGTLDASSLHIVMDALDRLQSQGRKVVLISHIADMHERIPVQIQVLPFGSGKSRIEIVG